MWVSGGVRRILTSRRRVGEGMACIVNLMCLLRIYVMISREGRNSLLFLCKLKFLRVWM